MGIGILRGLLNEVTQNNYFHVSHVHNHVTIGQEVDLVTILHSWPPQQRSEYQAWAFTRSPVGKAKENTAHAPSHTTITPLRFGLGSFSFRNSARASVRAPLFVPPPNFVADFLGDHPDANVEVV